MKRKPAKWSQSLDANLISPWWFQPLNCGMTRLLLLSPFPVQFLIDFHSTVFQPS